MPNAVGVGREKLVTAVDEAVPADFLLFDQNCNVFLNADRFVQIVFQMEIIAPAGETHFGDQFGRRANICLRSRTHRHSPAEYGD